MKRWTRNARDVLPEDIRCYQKDSKTGVSKAYWHNVLYMKALQVVRIGDVSLETFAVAMRNLDKTKKEIIEESKRIHGLNKSDGSSANDGKANMDNNPNCPIMNRHYTMNPLLAMNIQLLQNATQCSRLPSRKHTEPRSHVRHVAARQRGACSLGTKGPSLKRSQSVLYAGLRNMNCPSALPWMWKC